jgi:hypothetical protein
MNNQTRNMMNKQFTWHDPKNLNDSAHLLQKFFDWGMAHDTAVIIPDDTPEKTVMVLEKLKIIRVFHTVDNNPGIRCAILL